MTRRLNKLEMDRLTLSFSGRSISPDCARELARSALAEVAKALAEGEPLRSGVLSGLRVAPVEVDLARTDRASVSRALARNIVSALGRARGK